MAPTYLHSRVLKKMTTWAEDRRESEWDDHGESYPMTMNGPHLYCSLSIPAGLFYLSLYDVNYNGHAYLERFRDYTISIRQDSGRSALATNSYGRVILSPRPNFTAFGEQAELASARIEEFWGGVYKRFLVRGPAKLTVQMNRNYSFNTILAGVMLDLVDELPPPYYQTRESWVTHQQLKPGTIEAISPSPQAASISGTNQPEPLANAILHALHVRQLTGPFWWAMNQRRFHLPLARWYLAQAAAEPATNALALEVVTSTEQTDTAAPFPNEPR
jgi:hypothetical protein